MKINKTYLNVRYKHSHMKCTSLPRKSFLEHLRWKWNQERKWKNTKKKIYIWKFFTLQVLNHSQMSHTNEWTFFKTALCMFERS